MPLWTGSDLVDLLAGYLNRTDLLYDLREVRRQLDQAHEQRVSSRSVQTVRHGHGGRRKVTSRLTSDQIQDLIATFEASSATRQQLAERYGIGLTSVAKLLREWREGKHRKSA